MAESGQPDRGVFTGLKLPVTVEECIPGALLVSLRHETHIYRGLLLDSGPRDLPVGVAATRQEFEAHHQELVKPPTVVVDPNIGCSRVCEPSAVGLRHTYTPGATSADPSTLPLPRRDITRPLRDKNIRNMRLRPRQVLCSKCKQGVHETKLREEDGPPMPASPPKLPPSRLISPRVELRRIRPQDYLKVATPKKIRRLEMQETPKTSPIIKISFATPQGQESVVKIPRRPQGRATDLEDLKNTPEESPRAEERPSLNHQQYRKLRKALKKAKLKARHQGVTSPSSKDPTLSRKRSKHNKHKVKRKHKHKDGASQGISSNKAAEDDNTKENTIVADDLPPGGDLEKEEKEDAEWTENNNLCEVAPLVAVGLTEEYSISNSDDFSLKRKIKRSCISRAGSHDDNSRTSFDSGEFGGSGSGSNGLDIDDNLSIGSFNSEPNEICEADNFPVDSTNGIRPLTMRIHNRNVSNITTEGRELSIGDIVWGKIHGFPWWPGKMLSITESQRDNGVVIGQMAHVAWFGSSTMSHMECKELFPFLEFFKLRHNKKKRGPYKTAIKQATIAAQTAMSEGSEVDLALLED